jgi:hypothetical protein
MHRTDFLSAVTTIRLFPRLAMTLPSNHPRRVGRMRLTESLGRARETSGREERHAQVRQRLLRMILDNEQVRRNEQRPTAG